MAYFEKTNLADANGNLIASTNPLPVLDSTNAEAQQDMIILLTRMLNYLNSPQGYDKSLQRQRMTSIIESGTVNIGTLPTLTNLTTLANIVALGGVQAQIMPNGANMAAWQAAVRNRIT